MTKKVLGTDGGRGQTEVFRRKKTFGVKFCVAEFSTEVSCVSCKENGQREVPGSKIVCAIGRSGDQYLGRQQGESDFLFYKGRTPVG